MSSAKTVLNGIMSTRTHIQMILTIGERKIGRGSRMKLQSATLECDNNL